MRLLEECWWWDSRRSGDSDGCEVATTETKREEGKRVVLLPKGDYNDHSHDLPTSHRYGIHMSIFTFFDNSSDNHGFVFPISPTNTMSACWTRLRRQQKQHRWWCSMAHDFASSKGPLVVLVDRKGSTCKSSSYILISYKEWLTSNPS